jgi:NADH-quinone oxidoreductase subunit H
MNPLYALFALLIFPGLVYALPMGWLMLGVERRCRARFQGRLGPPLTQPFYDFVKLLAKTPMGRLVSDRGLFTGLPLLAVGSIVGALALLPVVASGSGFVGDLVLLVTLLELPPLCLVLAGYASRSIYGEVGATREAILSITSNVPFLLGIVAMAWGCGSLQLTTIATATPWAVRIPALLTILICLPVKLRLNPFSLANAEQELLAGPLTEFDGPRLALWELAHGLEWVALTGFVVTLAVPWRSGTWWIDAAAFMVLSLAMVPSLALLAASTARFKIMQASRLLWIWGSFAGLVALGAACYLRYWGN